MPQAKRPHITRHPEATRAKAQVALAKGLTPQEAAAQLDIPVHTIIKWRNKYKWLSVNELQARKDLPDSSQSALQLQAGEQLASDARLADPRQEAVLVQHRAQVDALRAQVDNVLAMPDLGAGPRGSPAQAAERLSATMQRLHALDRAAYGIQERAQQVVAVIVVPARAKSISDWQATIQGAVAGTLAGADPTLPRKRVPARVIEEPDPAQDAAAASGGPS